MLLKQPLSFVQGRAKELLNTACLKDPTCVDRVRRMSCQHQQLRQWLWQFGAERFFFVRSDDLKESDRRPTIMSALFDFLGLPHYTLPDTVIGAGREKNVGGSQRSEGKSKGKVEVDEDLARQALAACSEDLNMLLGYDTGFAT